MATHSPTSLARHSLQTETAALTSALLTAVAAVAASREFGARYAWARLARLPDGYYTPAAPIYACRYALAMADTDTERAAIATLAADYASRSEYPPEAQALTDLAERAATETH